LNLDNQPEEQFGGNNGPPDLDGNQNGNGQPTPPVGQDPNAADAFVNEFLKNVAPEDLPHVEKYYKDWGAKVTQSSQAKSEELQRYLDLGVDFDSIVAAVNLMKIGDTDPLMLYNQIGEYLKEEGLLKMPGEQEQEVDSMFDGASPELVKKFKDMEAKTTKFEQFQQTIEQERTNAAGQQELDKMMKELHTKHGEFDEMAVLARIMNGHKPDDAVKDYNDYLNKNYNPKPKATAPPVLGGGRTAVDQVDSSKIRHDKVARKALVNQLLGGIDT